MKVWRLIAGLLALANLGLVAAAEGRTSTWNAGFEQISIPMPGDAALPVTLWYPTRESARPQSFGPYELEVAVAGPPAPGHFPLIVLSHGTGGSAFDAVDLAMSLARSGFVVAAVEHTSDNYRDRRRSFLPANFLARPRQVSATIDFLLKDWRRGAMIDPARIGMFGHSAGGTTSLIVAGGMLDLGQLVRFCVDHPQDWGCNGAHGLDPTATWPAEWAKADAPTIAAPDHRVKALVLAAPAVAHGFAPAGLARLRLPIQLWVARGDGIVPDAGLVSALLAARPERHDVAGAGHFSFLSSCPDGLRARASQLCSDPQGFDRAAFQREFARTVIRFFRKHLRG